MSSGRAGLGIFLIFYHDHQDRDAAFWSLLTAIKAEVDPDGCLDPGVLGLGR